MRKLILISIILMGLGTLSAQSQFKCNDTRVISKLNQLIPNVQYKFYKPISMGTNNGMTHCHVDVISEVKNGTERYKALLRVSYNITSSLNKSERFTIYWDAHELKRNPNWNDPYHSMNR